ncbi:TIGR03621 family F420-dependent LLM class oxidoreductase [Actinobacteria bacterium YIM 96077]|uniref:LLM class F420-dependent oxidoreductase n=1 Tax=Phytoactinopolyspora halophila TaxID=1981511 RepID=A0A329QEG5_9ACTN|nr:TIGR03621 family F420-dependent LLM class oxidoreductase [Phytoactinopolyspora halophila]AYY13577.1 TIGR03621 family F420-dependent LLM class oxidoreductase [Actinobacteria bacterium YIM 96077]RAW10757.1 LLM class F420-dependent oxidoreductase [Phytoactinopolyspora halophila]
MQDVRFGFNTSGLRPANELAALCRTAEDIGYDVVLGTDHLNSSSPFLPLAVAADATERLRVGTLTTNNEFWNPALLARDTVTIDHLSEGRLELGLGAGHMRWEFEAAGLPWRGIAERVERLEQTIGELRRFFTDGINEPESGVRAREELQRPQLLPVQRQGFGGSGPPLLIGGTGNGSLRLAAAYADIIGFGGLFQMKGEPPGTFRLATSAELEERVAYMREQAGARIDEMEINVLVQLVAITGDRRGYAEQLVAEHLPYYTVEEALTTPFLLIGTAEQIAEQLRQNRERYGFSYITVHEPYMREFAPVIEKLRA